MLESKSASAATLAQCDALAFLAADGVALSAALVKGHESAETSSAASNQASDSDRADNLTESRQEAESMVLVDANVQDPANVRITAWSVDYEPVRLSSSTGPPKRFYRTFWRSVARRVLEQMEN